ncbi:hypothetical protein [Streptomyces phaeolivaceus]|uniref:hypothetical protein n=1 Tax=Streptomyces phaeolivaceus TaxID=2653200 RepID=UPI001D042D7E|nr:hypothetical protein [Streptomyces phaeolivaceus]
MSVAAPAWIPAAFTLPTAILELNFGVLGDLFGRGRPLVAGGPPITVGSLVVAASGAFSGSMTQLIAGCALRRVDAGAEVADGGAGGEPRPVEFGLLNDRFSISSIPRWLQSPLSSHVPNTPTDPAGCGGRCCWL